jgi:multidrug efflux system outer membrane protein
MRLRAALASAAAAALLGAAGCNLAPPLTLPDAGTPSAWRDGAAEVETLANVRWFDVYDDPVLRELIQEAIARNPNLEVALARVDEARAIARATGADLAPRVDLSGQGGVVRSTRDAAAGDDRTSGFASVSFDLAWEVDVFGRIRNQTAAARARYFASVEAHRDVGMRLVAEVARVYFELRALDEALGVTERTVKSSGEYVDLAKIRFEGGKTSEVDFRQSEGEYHRTDAVRIDLLRQIATKEHEMSLLLGRAPDAVPRGRQGSDQTTPGHVPAGLPSELLRRRPDVAAAEQVMIAETALVGAARANLYPRIALTGSFGWESDQLADLFTSPSATSSLIAGLLQPIFDAGRNRALVEAQCARMRAAMHAYRGVVLAAFGEVETGLVSYRRFGEQRRVQDLRVDALRKVLDLAETRYVGGKTEYLEVLDAQRGLFDAELERVDTVRGHLVSLTVLYKALGGGWDPTLYGGAPCAPAPPPAPYRPAPSPSIVVPVGGR